MKRAKHLFIISLVFYVLCFLSFQGCSNRPFLSRQMILMGSSAKITIVSDSSQAQEAMDEAFAILKEYDQMMSYYAENSELTMINQHAAKIPVEMSKDMFEIINRALEYSNLTDGIFDITATTLQRQSRYDTIIIRPNRGIWSVSFRDPHTKIDLGGIVVGFSIDKVVARFAELGIKDFLIDVGGDIYAKGKNAQGKNWQIGIRDPFNSKRVIKKVALVDEAVTTSGNYVKHHIIDPVSKKIVESDILSVTVFSEKCVDADVLATAFFIMGMEKTTEFLRNNSGRKVVFVVNEDGKAKVVKMKGE
ncbi:MAG: FAD:protein FMN transferase [PVC group bacterium]|nr:FAD:protein FMN transferase [PVC group bacterium]